MSAVDVVKACYARIGAVNPKINAVVMQCRERALAEAEQADVLLAAGKPGGPLHGVPFTIKDSFDTAGVISTGGTLGRKDYVPGEDATVIARPRAVGGLRSTTLVATPVRAKLAVSVLQRHSCTTTATPITRRMDMDMNMDMATAATTTPSAAGAS